MNNKKVRFSPNVLVRNIYISQKEKDNKKEPIHTIQQNIEKYNKNELEIETTIDEMNELQCSPINRLSNQN